jgi:hypothetical protein
MAEFEREGLSAPEDEYVPEAEEIAYRMDECKSEEDMRALIKEVFDHWFNSPHMPEDRLDAAAEKIWYEYQKSKGVELPEPSKKVTSKWGEAD